MCGYTIKENTDIKTELSVRPFSKVVKDKKTSSIGNVCNKTCQKVTFGVCWLLKCTKTYAYRWEEKKNKFRKNCGVAFRVIAG